PFFLNGERKPTRDHFASDGCYLSRFVGIRALSRLIKKRPPQLRVVEEHREPLGRPLPSVDHSGGRACRRSSQLGSSPPGGGLSPVYGDSDEGGATGLIIPGLLCSDDDPDQVRQSQAPPASGSSQNSPFVQMSTRDSQDMLSQQVPVQRDHDGDHIVPIEQEEHPPQPQMVLDEPVERSRLRLLQEIRSLTGRQAPRTHGGAEL
ncbi:hypothetical protein HPB47_018212, partial [Ixodes persulcatus]